MKRITSVIVKGFKALDNVCFTFPPTNGLCHMAGSNLADPDLGGNAVGKTSFWDAIVWCFFGKTVAGSRVPASWSKKEKCSVLVALDDDMDIVRTRSPNKVLMNGKEVTQEEVNNYLNRTYESFCHSHVLGQYGRRFFDMSSTEQTELFSSILGLNRWKSGSEVAAEEAKILLDESQAIETEISKLEGELSGLKIEEYKKSHRLWSLGHKETVDRQDRKVRLARKELDELANKTTTNTKRKTFLSRKVSVFEGEIEKVSVELDKLEENDYRIRGALNSLEDKETEAVKEIEWYEDLEEGDVCEMCGQAIGPTHRRKAVSKLRRDLRSIRKHKRTLKGSSKEAMDKLIEAKNRREELKDKISNLRELIKELDLQASWRDAELKAAKKAFDREVEYQSEVKSATSPYTELLRKEEQRKEGILKDLVVLRSDNERKLKRIARVSYWVKGFRDVKLMQIVEALSQLEAEVNSSAIALGLIGWSISFDVDKLTKSKTLQKGFTVMIKSPTSGEHVSWSEWSGGEQQRLRLAGQMGLANLIRDRKGEGVDIEVWDEPTTHLSPEGLDSLMETLKWRGRDRSVWVVDHHIANYSGFDALVWVTKTDKGSEVSYGYESEVAEQVTSRKA